MNSLNKKYTEIPFPKERYLISDPLDAARNKNNVCGVGEMDITKLRQDCKKFNVSFLSRIIYAVSQAAVKNPAVNSYKKGKRKIVTFNEVDICIMIERAVGSIKLPLPYIIRNANVKSLQEINSELINARKGDLNEIYLHKDMRLYLSMPKFIRMLFWKYLLRNPHQFKKGLGTIAITALHSRGDGLIHFDPSTPYTVTVALGKIYKNAEGKDLMYYTLSIDHDIIDGMDAIKFAYSFSNSQIVL